MLSAAPRGLVAKQAFSKTVPATSTLTLFTESNQRYTEATGWKVKKNTSSLGFEPRTFGLEVQHAIRCTTRTCWKIGFQIKTIPATSTLTLFTESNQLYTEATGWKVKKNTSSLGFEPRTFGLEVQHAIRCTTRTCWKTGVQQNHSSYVNINFVYRKQSTLYRSHWLKS